MVRHHPPVSERVLRAKRRAIESLYCGRIDAFQEIGFTDEHTHVTEFKKMRTVYNEPCRKIEVSSTTTTRNEPAKQGLEIKVMLRPEVSIPAGSTVILTQHGERRKFKMSGTPEIYSDHQVIPLTLFEEYA